jgi:hypothetical protein
VKKEYDLWIDFTNPPHVNLYKSFLNDFEKNNLTFFSTSREFVETEGLLKKYAIDFNSFGKHGGSYKLSKLFQLLKRDFILYWNVPNYRYSISSSFEAAQVSWLRRRKSIFFDDNEIAPNWLYGKFCSHVLIPNCINPVLFEKSGISLKKIIPYNGFKENIYLADYIPDNSFLNEIPFNEYVVVRPENTKAAYVSSEASSIVPKLIEELTNEGLNILFLPRYESDKNLISNSKNVFSPSLPINGLDACFYSSGVFTGAGTMAREAAILGKPSFSFFANSELLSVDRKMISDGILYHSRSPKDLINNFIKSKHREFKIEKSKAVKIEVVSILLELLQS